MTRRLMLMAFLCACSRPSEKTAAPPEANAPPQATTTAKPAGSAKGSKAATTPDAAKESPKIAEDDDLKAEEREANPYSETVTLKLTVTPSVKALVTWGGKQVAKLAPGDMDTELTRPRDSGPVDLEIKAEGYMPYHTRLYSDRNDKVNVRLYRIEEAPGMFGYKRPANPAAKAEKTEKAEKKK
jgi:hypothetical protein